MDCRNDTSAVLERAKTHDPDWRRKVDSLGDKIATLAAQLTAAEYRLLCKIREFDDCDGWYHHGARSCAHWLNWRIGLGMVAAREKVRVARALEELPLLSAAMERGAVSYSKVRALTRIATPETEQDLLENAQVSTASHIEKMVRLYRHACRPDELRRSDEQQTEKLLKTYWDDDGMFVIEGRLPAEEGAIVEQALEAARRQLFDKDDSAESSEAERASTEAAVAEDDSAESSGAERASTEAAVAESDSAESEVAAPQRTISWPRQRADALVQVAEAALAAEGSPHGARAQVTVHVDAAVLADVHAAGRSELEDGAAIAADTVRRLSCDADVLAIVHGEEGEPLGPGRRSRKVTSRLRRTLWQRDQGCVFPGCTCQQYLHAHHVQHWAEGGPTELDNLVMLCRYHHRLVHEGGFSVDTHTGEPRFFSPLLHQRTHHHARLGRGTSRLPGNAATPLRS